MIVGAWMSAEVETVGPGTSLGDVAVCMTRRRIRRVPVVEPGTRRLVGLVSASDLHRAFPPGINPFTLGLYEHRGLTPSAAQWGGVAAQPASSVMATALYTTRPETLLTDAAQVLVAKKIGALPVTRQDELVGIITETDIFRAFSGLFALSPTDSGLVVEAPQGGATFSLFVAAAAAAGVRLLAVTSSKTPDRSQWFVRVEGRPQDFEGFIEKLRHQGVRTLGIHRASAAQGTGAAPR